MAKSIWIKPSLKPRNPGHKIHWFTRDSQSPFLFNPVGCALLNHSTFLCHFRKYQLFVKKKKSMFWPKSYNSNNLAIHSILPLFWPVHCHSHFLPFQGVDWLHAWVLLVRLQQKDHMVCSKILPKEIPILPSCLLEFSCNGCRCSSHFGPWRWDPDLRIELECS